MLEACIILVAALAALGFCLENRAMQVDTMERFDSEQKLLSIELDLPNHLLEASGPPADSDHFLTLEEASGHISLLQHQVMQVRHLLELLVSQLLHCSVSCISQTVLLTLQALLDSHPVMQQAQQREGQASLLCFLPPADC